MVNGRFKLSHYHATRGRARDSRPGALGHHPNYERGVAGSRPAAGAELLMERLSLQHSLRLKQADMSVH